MDKCSVTLCKGPQECLLREYLQKPQPSPIPGDPSDDVVAAGTMTGCPIREELEQQYPAPFEKARRSRP